jgi:hypothetical protein
VDGYTETTRDWLDHRFGEVDEDGVYFAHQPIYGFRAGHCESSAQRYVITWQILRALGHLRFESLVDIGGAEGYKAALVRDVFGTDVYSCDLSAAACRRAKAIFDVDGESVDIHALPFADGQFDVVLCSETLEHVARIEDATRELLRVARKAVVITVPHEPIEVVEQNIRDKVPHGHIHALDPHSFDFAAPVAKRIIVRRLQSPALGAPFKLMEAERLEGEGSRWPSWMVRAYNRSTPLIRRLLGHSAEGALIRLDDLAAKRGEYGDMLFVLLKDEAAWSETALTDVSPRSVVDFRVPLHYPNGRTESGR